MPKRIDLTGKKYGRLTVIELNEKKGKHFYWKCKCDCGSQASVCTTNLRTGHTTSCGCTRKETTRERSVTHGMRKTTTYSSWVNMIQRCTNSNNDKYESYGGRGIIVCERWINSFENFYADMGEAPSPKHSIDRKDVNGNYEPSNCRWATIKEQANNKRNNFYITYNGITKTIPNWSREIGIPIMTIRNRINLLGWSTEKALTTPTKDRKV